jgi:hypothetical protein
MSSCRSQTKQEIEAVKNDYKAKLVEGRVLASDGTSYEASYKAIESADSVDSFIKGSNLRLGRSTITNNFIEELGEVLAIDRTSSNGTKRVKAEVLNVKVIDDVTILAAKVDNEVEVISFNRYGESTEVGGIKYEIPGLKAAVESIKNKGRRVKLSSEAKELLQGNIDLGSSSQKGLVDLRDYVKQEDYEHGNVEHMVGMLHKLNGISRNPSTQEFIQHAEGLLKGLHNHFLRGMNLYLRENADTSSGVVSLANNAIAIKVGKDKPKSTYATDAEVYLEEVLHTATAFAFRNNSNESNKLIRELRYLVTTAQAKTSWKDLLRVQESTATEEDIKNAKELYKYVFSSENADEEFLAKGLSNPAVYKHFQSINVLGSEGKATTMYQKIMDFFYKLMDVVLGRYNFADSSKSAADKLTELAIGLSEVNWRAQSKVEDIGVLGTINDSINDLDNAIAGKLKEFYDNVLSNDDPIERLPPDASVVEKTLFMAKFIGKAVTNKEYRKAMALVADGLGLKQEGTVQEFLATQFEESESKQAANWLKLANDMIDNQRNLVISSTENHIKKAFTRPLSEAEEVAITRALIDTNLGHLAYYRDNDKGVTNARLREWLTDDKVLLNHIYEVRQRVLDSLSKTPERANWVANQAHGLGYYMATGLTNEQQNLSGLNIVRGIGTNQRFEIDDTLLANVKELATLNAVRYTNQEYRNTLAELLKTEYEGVKRVANIYEAFKNDSSNKLFSKDPIHMIDGYSKELFDDTVVQAVVPISRKQEMEDAGYRYVGKLPKHASIVDGDALGVFISEGYTKVERLRGAVNLGGLSAKGSSLKEQKYNENPVLAGALFERDLIRLQRASNKIAIEMTKSSYDPAKHVTGVSPVYDNMGEVTDFRYVASKRNKEEWLGQNLKVSEVLARSMGSVVDKTHKEVQNKRVLEFLKKTMEEQWEGGELGKDTITKFTLIGPRVADRKMRETYQMLPSNIREWVSNRPDQTLAVPSELLNILFGYPHMSLANIEVLKQLPKLISSVVKIAENFWFDFIKILKSTILIRIPQILITNIISNAIYVMNTGTLSIPELVRMHSESYRDVKEYMNNHKEAVRLSVMIKELQAQYNRAGNKPAITAKISSLKAALEIKERHMKSSKIHELVEAGMFQTVVEDVETSSLNTNNKITSFLDEVTGKLPGVIREPARILYLSDSTAYAKISKEFLQLSDLMARDMVNRRQKVLEMQQADGKKPLPREFLSWYEETYHTELNPQQRLVGEVREVFLKKAKESRHYNLLKSFINYNQPNGRFEEWLNRAGLFMFTKYVKNIQRIITQTSVNHPVKTILSLLTFQFLFNQDIIHDQAFMIKGFGQDGEFGLTNIFPFYNPLDSILTVVNPPLIQLVT